LHDDSGPVGEPGEPYGRKNMTFSDKKRGQEYNEIFVPEKP